MKFSALFTLLGFSFMLNACTASAPHSQAETPQKTTFPHEKMAAQKNNFKLSLSKEEWQRKLSPQDFYILREQGTERAFTGTYWNEKRPGIFRCKGCGQVLFSSKTKFKSGTGWPSFWEPYQQGLVEIREDNSSGMQRKEVVCSRCGGHLGHVFEDGPRPTGLRYCINSASLDFKPAQ